MYQSPLKNKNGFERSNFMNIKFVIISVLLILIGNRGLGQYSITTLPQTYVEPFTWGTANITWTDNTTKTGWYVSSASPLTADNGSTNSNKCYNYGTTASTD